MHRLLTIPISHYCEKARWALERARVPYRHEAHLQGLHYLFSLSAGRSRSVPVLVTSDGPVLTESRAILEFTDRHVAADQRLFTGDAEVSNLADRFDGELGPHTRRWMYFHVLPDRALLWRFGRTDIPRWESAVFPPLIPLVSRFIERGLEIDEAAAARSLGKSRRIMDEVAERLGDGRPYLVGARFSAADLTFACMLAPLILPREYGVRLPTIDQMPESARPTLTELASHPAAVFATRMFREERHR